ncbi:MAG: hypothetical protein M3Y64_00550 [Gemmatimonadota bacterium]|nr:hypothetical protein [Gemmatimonadota bacterium]
MSSAFPALHYFRCGLISAAAAARARRPAAWITIAAAFLATNVVAAQQPPKRPPVKADTSMAGMPGMRTPAKPKSASTPKPVKQPATKVDTSMASMHGLHVTAAPARDTTQSMMMVPNPLGIPMTRMGSGTSWVPDSAPMHAHHVMAGAWELMLHGVAVEMYDKQNGLRGSEQFSSVNWGMLMASREAGGGKLSLRGMVSAEAFTVGGNGYPLLLQTGEEFHGQPLHDRQHPHDLFMELAALYERPITNAFGVSLYVAPVGEPAFGPVAFPHRPSAMNDPFAPISHHWQDATHIAFGVLTAGVFTHSLKLEASVFNGREPDENRTNFDYRGRSLDSYASRVTLNPSGEWSVSASYAYLKSPETVHPEESLHKIGASVLNNRSFGTTGTLSSALIFGGNRPSTTKTLSPSVLLESSLEIGNGHSLFGRAEYVRKSAEELVLGANAPAQTFNVGELTLGYLYEFDRMGAIRTGLGVRAAVNVVPSNLSATYGSRSPTGYAVYVRFRPAPMVDHGGNSMEHSMGKMKGMSGKL